MGWKDRLKGDPLPWLLERDEAQPGIRFLALRDLLGRPGDDPEAREARSAVTATGPVPAILAAQAAEGYWDKPGPGYAHKYTGTVWQLIFLAQLGADGSHPRVRAGCEYLLSHAIAAHGGLSVNGTPSLFIHCHSGNLLASLIELGWSGDARVSKALDYLARMATGEGMGGTEATDTVRRYYKSGTCAPDFACSANAGLPCAWGAVKAMLALGKVRPEQRSSAVKAAIERGAALLLSRDPAIADYPTAGGTKPSSSWFKLGWPSGYVTDVLQNLEALAALGYAGDPRLANALALVESKQDARGRWKMEYSYNGKMWIDIEKKGQPSKWMTLRALRVLKAAYGE